MPAVREKFASEMENDVSLTDVCRLCAESYDSRSFIPLFTEDKRERIIAKQINQLVVNLVSPDDGLPEKICLKCSKNVELCYSFVCNVIETQNKLKRLKRVADQKLKRMSDNEFVENYRLENITLKDYDNGLNTGGRSVSKSSIYPDTTDASEVFPHVIDIDCEERSTTEKTLALSGNSSNATTYENCFSSVASFSSKESSPAQSQRPESDAVVSDKNKTTLCCGNFASCLYRCGVCLEKFKTKDECMRHMMSSHTPPSFVSSANGSFRSIAFDVVCKNGNPECTVTDTYPYDRRTAQLVRDDVNSHNRNAVSSSGINNSNHNHHHHKSKLQKSAVEMSLSSFKSRRKILAIDSFYKEMKKNCTRYKCDICGRLMTSWFAFKRHLHEHRETVTDDDAVAGKLDGRTTKSLVGGALAKPLIGYCKICNKLVKHFRRHSMYHTIVKLELKYPKFVKFLSV